MAGRKKIVPTEEELKTWPGYQPPYDTETESKRKLRLNREGLWDEFIFCVEKLAKGVKGKGSWTNWQKGKHLIRQEAKYFPLVESGSLPLSEQQPQPFQEPVKRAVVEDDPFPWAGLPTTIDFKADVLWAYENWGLVVHNRVGASTLFHWKKATRPPPSTTTRGYLEAAASNPTRFFFETVPKVLGFDDGGAEEGLKAERKSIEEIRDILKRIEELAKEKT